METLCQVVVPGAAGSESMEHEIVLRALQCSDVFVLAGLLDEVRHSAPRIAAEIGYVLARRYQAHAALAHGEERRRWLSRAYEYGSESIRLLDHCSLDTLEECATRFAVLLGVALPSYIHQEVVRDRLRELEV